MDFGPWTIWNGGTNPVPNEYVQPQYAAQTRADALDVRPVPSSGLDWQVVNTRRQIIAYRVLTQPVVVTLFGRENAQGEWLFKETREQSDTHRIRFRIVNGVVDVANVQMVAAP